MSEKIVLSIIAGSIIALSGIGVLALVSASANLAQ